MKVCFLILLLKMCLFFICYLKNDLNLLFLKKPFRLFWKQDLGTGRQPGGSSENLRGNNNDGAKPSETSGRRTKTEQKIAKPEGKTTKTEQNLTKRNEHGAKLCKTHGKHKKRNTIYGKTKT